MEIKMDHLIDLGKLINVSDYDTYIQESETLEIVLHKYGQEMSIPDYTCWMKYPNNISGGGISFTRHTNQHPILKELTVDIHSKLLKIFPKNITPLQNRIHIIKTEGNITPHIDESSRMACINIGLKNSSAAITKISNDNRLENFQKNNTEYNLKDGHAYLMNTNQLHSVNAISLNPRYLITYGFGTSFDLLKSLFIPSLVEKT
jgi:hypothetical protein